MKELTLIRHAKSDWDNQLDDHQRPLNSRGQRDAPAMGETLAQKSFSPDWITSSTAVRAISTARTIAEKIGYDPDQIITTDDIYLASTESLLRQIQHFDEDLTSVAMFGHNPGFECLADHLLGPESVGPMVTCAVVRMKLEVDYWAEAGENCATLVEHLWPKML